MARPEMRKLLTLLGFLLMINDFSSCCPESEKSEGCRIVPDVTGQLDCLCGTGCKREFPFHSRIECEAQIRDGIHDMCISNPCQNRGVCVQLKYGGYRCECTGTGYYGRHCEKDCPDRIGRTAFGFSETNFPLECLVI